MIELLKHGMLLFLLFNGDNIAKYILKLFYTKQDSSEP